MAARQADPSTRVLVFVDGQNVYKYCQGHFGWGRCHPLLLAKALAGTRRLVGVRYYSGIHDPRVDPMMNAMVQRRHDLIGKAGVTVQTRLLRYRWDWGFTKTTTLPNAFKYKGPALQADVAPYQRAREKGIDLALGLDVFAFAIDPKPMMDVAIVVSADNDLCEVARMVHDRTRKAATGRVSVEAAVVNTKSSKPLLLEHYDYTHQITQAMFDGARDNFDYRAELDSTLVGPFLASCAGLVSPV